jgi:pimeloyl-ACP methyl ester carboxylesterase
VLESKTVTLRKGPAHEVLHGGRGAPLVWLHGVTRPTVEDPMLGALAEHFEVFAPLMPGFADRDELSVFHDIGDLALRYDSVLDALGLDGITLAGHSFGGMLAAEIAAHVPRRITKLVLVSPLGLWNDAHPIEDLFARPYPAIDDLLWQGAVERPAMPEAASNREEDTVERLVEVANGVGAIAKFTWPIPDKGLRRRLYRVTMPTLLAFGENDALVPPVYADEFAAEIAGARKLVWKGSHMLPYEAPDRIAAAIAEFAAS